MRYPQTYLETESQAWREIVADVMRAAVGVAPQDLVGHWTLGARLVWSGGGWCLKASDDYDVRCEAATCRLARAAGVPAPEVVAEGTDERVPGGRWFVMRFIEGRECAERPDELRDVGAALRALHSVEMDRFGREDDHSSASWHEWLSARVDEAARIVDDPGVADLVAQLPVDGVPCRLLHGDPQLSHFRIVAGRLSGVIDFADSVGGDPVWDFARLFVGMGDSASAELADRALPTVLEGYGAIDLSRLEAYRCAVSLLELACNAWHKWPEWVQRSRTLLLQRLDAFTRAG